MKIDPASVPVILSVQIGGKQIPVSEVINYNKDEILKFDEYVKDECKIFMSGMEIGKGRVIVTKNKYYFKITKLDI